MTNIKHFEEIWNEAEALADTKLKATTTEQIISEIVAEFDSYKLYHTKEELSPEIKKLLKQRNLGAIMFLICALAKREDINVYSSLVEEMRFEQLDMEKLKEMLEKQAAI